MSQPLLQACDIAGEGVQFFFGVDERADRALVVAEGWGIEGTAWPRENIARSNTFLTQSGRRRVPGVARCAAGSLPLTSEGGAVWANERTCGSVWGVLSGRSSFRDQYMKAKEEK